MLNSLNVYRLRDLPWSIRMFSFVAVFIGLVTVNSAYTIVHAADVTVAQQGALVTALSAGNSHNCEIRSDNSLACWGLNDDGEASPPSGLFTQVAAGFDHTCAIKTDGTLICWGNPDSVPQPPAGVFTQVSSGVFFSCAIKDDKTVACWGSENGDNQLSAASGSFTQISAGDTHVCGVKTGGSIACWGANDEGQASPPSGVFKQVSAGQNYTCAIKNDNTVTCWGNNDYDQWIVPSGAFKQISAGLYSVCGVKTDSTVVCWGDNSEGQSTPPTGLFTQVEGGEYHTCGLRNDGTIVCWGYNEDGEAPTLALSPVTLPVGQVNVAYSQPIIVSAENYTPTTPILTLISGALPTGLTLDGTANTLNGTPTVGGAFVFSLRAIDANGFRSETEFTLKINRAPIANSQSITVGPNKPSSISLTATDPEGDALTYSIVANPTHGALSGALPNIVYTPNNGYSGTDSFTFKANDGQADSNTATVQINVTANQTPNTPPVANSQNVATPRNTSRKLTLTASDIDHNVLTYSVLTNPAHGVLGGVAPNLTYTPTANFTGADSFTFKVNDGQADSNVATISLSVSANNTAPVANDQRFIINRNTALTFTLRASDSEGDTLTYSVTDNPTNGTLTGTPPQLTYTPKTDFFGIDYLHFKANDGQFDSNFATIAITITPGVVNISVPPIADNQNVAVPSNTPKPIKLTGSDAQGASLKYIVLSNPAHGKLNGVAPDLTYTPEPGFVGSDKFTFKVNNGAPVDDGTDDSNVATISIQVIAANTPPVANDQNVSILQNTAHIVVLSASDAEGNALAYSVVSNPTHGALSGTAPNLTYTPNAGYTGADSFTFKVNDGQADSNVATVSLNVTTNQTPNTPPLANDQSITGAQDTAQSITLTASDAEGNPLTYSVVSNPAHGALSGTAPNLTYTPNPGYSGTDSFTFKANDGQADSNVATVNITIVPATPPQGSIRGVVFDDKNGNGEQDAGETGIANVTVSLNSAADTVTGAGITIQRQTTTNADGVYEFAQVPAGNYTLQIQAPSNFSLAGPTQITITVSQTGEVTPAPFTLKSFVKIFLPVTSRTNPAPFR
ncbi:MAG: Ig-like domain-containing protein [Caldilineaceae bacterium]